MFCRLIPLAYLRFISSHKVGSFMCLLCFRVRLRRLNLLSAHFLFGGSRSNFTKIFLRARGVACNEDCWPWPTFQGNRGQTLTFFEVFVHFVHVFCLDFIKTSHYNSLGHCTVMRKNRLTLTYFSRSQRSNFDLFWGFCSFSSCLLFGFLLNFTLS